jgi:hypothetical protein
MVTNKMYLTKEDHDGEVVKLSKGDHKVTVSIDDTGQIKTVNGYCLVAVSNIISKLH